MNTFLGFLAKEISEKHQNKLEDILIVLPNKRGGLFLRNEFSKIIHDTTWLPKVTDTISLIEEFSETTILDNLTLILELYNTYLNTTKNKKKLLSFNRFISFGETLLQDFNEIDRYLLDTESFFKTINNVYALENWEIKEEDIHDSKIGDFIQLWEEMEPLYRAFNEQLKAKNASYQGMAYRIAAEAINKGKIRDKTADYKYIYFAGFNALNKAEETIIKQLIENKKAAIFWDTDNYYMKDEAQEAGLFLRKFIKDRYFKSSFCDFDHLSTMNKKIEICSATQNISQVKWAGQIIQEIAEKTPNLTKTAIVLADEALLLPLLQTLPASIDNVNITMGLPLSQSAVYNFFRLLLKMQNNEQKLNQNGFYHKDIEVLLDSAIFNQLFKSKDIKAFKKQLKQKNITFYYPEQDEDKLLSNEQMKLFFTRIQEPQDIINFFQVVCNHLKDTFIADQNRFHFLLEQLYNFQQIINKLSNLQKSYSCFDSIESLNYFMEHLSQTHKIDFVGEPLTGLQVLGMLETRNLDFKNVILLGANEDILPMGKTNSTFITNDIKHHFQLPGYKKKDAIYAYHFYHLIQRAENIYISYNNESEGLKSGEKSRFVTQLEYEFNQKNKISPAIKNTELAFKKYNNNSKSIEIEKNEVVLKQIDYFLKNKSLSPSGLNAFFACPLDFYYRRIIGIHEKDEIDDEIDARILGNIVHEVLQNIYTPYEKKIINTKELKEIKDDVIRKWIDQAFKNNFVYLQTKKGKNYLSFEIILRLIKNFLKKDVERIEKAGPTSIVMLEKNLKAGKTLIIGNKKVQLQLNGKVDRIEKQGNKIIVIDYKTGTTGDSIKIKDTGFQPQKKPKSLQVLFYAYLVIQNAKELNLSIENVNAAIYDLQHLQNNLKMLKADKLQQADLNLFEEILEKDFLSSLYDTSTLFIHNDKAIYCGLC